MATETQTLTGAATPTGALHCKVKKKSLTGGVTPTSTLLNDRAIQFSGSVAPAGALRFSAKIVRSGGVTPTSLIRYKPKQHVAGVVAPFGALSAGVGESPCNITVSRFKSLLWERLDDDGTYYTAAEVLHALNVMQRLFCLLTLCIERTVTFTLTNGVAFYEIDNQISDFLVPLRVSHSGTRLRNETIHNMDLRDGAWRTRPGNPRRYAIEGVSPGILAITPRPASGSHTLAFTYAAEPAALVLETDVPEIAPEQQPHLVDGAYWWLRLKEGGAEFAAAGQYLQRLLAATSKYASFTRARSRAQSYDSIPYDLATFDKSRFEIKIKQLQVMQKKKQEGQ